MSRTIRFLLTLFCLAALIGPVSAHAAAPQPPSGRANRPYGPHSLPLPADGFTAQAASAQVSAAPAEAQPVNNWSRIAFESARDGNWEIYSMRPDGSDVRRLTFNKAEDSWPRQSHADGQIAFISDRTGNFDIYSMAPDGSRVRQLTSDAANDFDPAWSADGRRIAFSSNRSGNWDIYVMNADGSGVVPFVAGPTIDVNPVWSPDGRYLAWIRMEGNMGQVWVIGADGSSPHTLSNRELYLENLAWSPDSQRIAFDYDAMADGDTDILFVLADGSTPSPIFLYDNQGTSTDAILGGYAPDGSRYVFALVKYVVVDNEAYIDNATLATKPAWSQYDAAVSLPGSGYDLRPDWQRTDFTPPSSRLDAVPALYGATEGAGLRLTWIGSDAGGSGIAYYNFQFKVNDGPWTPWANPLTEPAVVLGWQQYGATMYYRVQAVDAAGNAEPWSTTPNGDGHTTFYKERFYGYVLDSRQMPIPGARIEGSSNPPIPFTSGPDGSYSAYSFDGFAFLRAAHPVYAALLDSHHYNIVNLRWDMVLSAKVNAVTNGGFEDGLTGWQPVGVQGLTPFPNLSHSGAGSMGIARWMPDGPGTTGLSQSIQVPAAANHPTLSFAVRRDSELQPLDLLHVTITPDGGSAAQPVLHWGETSGEWAYAWADLSEWGGKTVTLAFTVTLKAGESGGFIVDEVAVGEWHTPRITSVAGPAGLSGTITVKGENFEPGATVGLDDKALTTTYVDANTLTAELTAGVRPGTRDLWVTNPGGEQALASLRLGRPVFLPLTVNGN